MDSWSTSRVVQAHGFDMREPLDPALDRAALSVTKAVFLHTRLDLLTEFESCCLCSPELDTIRKSWWSVVGDPKNRVPSLALPFFHVLSCLKDA